MMITKTLEAIGMTERQAKLYITGLKSGVSSAREIAEQARENRITTYKTLKEMVLLGYAKESTKEKKAYFSMINPDEILEQQEKKTRVLKESMPELVGLMKSFGEQPKIMVYEGLEEIKNFYFSFLQSQSEIRVFVGLKSGNESFNNFIKNEYTPEKIKSKIKVKAIVNSSNGFYESKFENNEYVYVDNAFVSTSTDIMIYDNNKIAICTYSPDNLSAFVIHSNTVYNFLAGIFDSTYNLLKSSNK